MYSIVYTDVPCCKGCRFCREHDSLLMAAGPGFEPGQTDSKSGVLPLHNPATGYKIHYITPLQVVTTLSVRCCGSVMCCRHRIRTQRDLFTVAALRPWRGSQVSATFRCLCVYYSGLCENCKNSPGPRSAPCDFCAVLGLDTTTAFHYNGCTVWIFHRKYLLESREADAY